MQKRYNVTEFPAYLGNPYLTNWWILARWVAFWRKISRAWEVRLEDTKTGKEKVW